MGVLKITERQEVQKGAATYQTGSKIPDLSSAAAAGPAALGRALSGIGDGVKDFSVALAKIDETDADSAVREIRKFSDHVLNVGYRDPNTGVQEPGIATDDRIEMIRGSANRHDALVNSYARNLLKGANESVRRLVSEKTDEMRSRITHSLKKRETIEESKFQLQNLMSDITERSSSFVDSQLIRSRTMRNSPLAEYVAHNAMAAEIEGRSSDPGFEERISRQASDSGTAFGSDYAEGFEELKAEVESIREGASHRLKSFCLHGEFDAKNKADVLAKKSASDVIQALVDDKDFGRARAYAERLMELGFGEEQKSGVLRAISEKERIEAEREINIAEKEKAKAIKAARDESNAREFAAMAEGNPGAPFYEDEAVAAAEAGDMQRAKALRSHANELREAAARGREDEARRQEAKSRQEILDNILEGQIKLFKGGNKPDDNALADYLAKAAGELEGVDKKGAAQLLESAARLRERAKANAESDRGKRASEETKAREDKILEGQIKLFEGGKSPNPDALADYLTESAKEMSPFDKAGALRFLVKAAGIRDESTAMKLKAAHDEAARRADAARAEEARARAVVKSNETDLRWDIINLYDLADKGKDTTQAQLDLCRKMDVMKAQRMVTPQYAETFRTALEGVNNAGVRRGVLMFARQCGVDFEQLADGGYSKSTRDGNAAKDISPEWAGDGMIGEQFFALTDRLQRSLESMNNDISRPGAAKAAIDEMVREYRSGGYEKALQSIEKTVYEYILKQRTDQAETLIREDREHKKKIQATREAAEEMDRQNSWQF